MDSLVHTLLSNALTATFMAVIAMALARMCRRPALYAQRLAIGDGQARHAAVYHGVTSYPQRYSAD